MSPSLLLLVVCLLVPPHPLDQVVLDENVQAEGASYCDIADVSPSPGGHELAAYAADMTGYEVGGTKAGGKGLPPPVPTMALHDMSCPLPPARPCLEMRPICLLKPL